MKLPIAGLLAIIALHAATIPMDSLRGDQVFRTQGCIQCHQLKGAGGHAAPDLGRVLDRGYNPSDLAAAMWNHAPAMWAAIAEKGINIGDIGPQASADLFASFYSARYFETPGDAGRGKRLFGQRSCATCHGLKDSPNPAARPVSQWQTLTDPIALVGAMWNHSPVMWDHLDSRDIIWPHLTAPELSDLLVYLRNATAGKGADPILRVTAGDNGQKLFEVKGCVSCHDSRRPAKLNLTLTGVAASMWNHAGLLHTKPPRIEPEEMRELLSSYWARQFFESSGDATRGKRLFAAKRCVECHAGSGPGPALFTKSGTYNGITMVSGLWRHGPAMLAEMKQKSIAWPVFKTGEMSDLIAYLNAGDKH